MKLLITGGAGFIGSHTADFALSMGMEVVVVDSFRSGKEEFVDPKCIVYKADIAGKELRDIFESERPDYCIHLAEQTDGDELLARGLNPNLGGLIHLLDMCREFPVKKLVYGSSANVYGATELIPVNESFRCAPLSGSARAKLTSEEYIKQYGALYGIPFTILRYANVYGFRQNSFGDGSVISEIMETYTNGERPVIYGKGMQARDFVYVTDVAAANIQALSIGGGQTYNIGTGRSIRVIDLLNMMNEMMEQKKTPAYMPSRPEDHIHYCISYRKAEEEFGWRPKIHLKEGLTQLLGDFIYRRFMDNHKLPSAPPKQDAV
ncbi:NAD-dependent epimerase/dehydratase family protein [Paenibacillus rigui]|uniref:UDP-glucose 4-epimerase n=1 Tax=Paenibacillus rigui TaxID=554312 RepID=A0A229UP33_9BACL|nr:NAD-dependent epimerase/dehydratase family protein [Paenibacillus rigui]OXM85113.1 UDP-glucose 4-epimerase [Paenibacillus rigui]